VLHDKGEAHTAAGGNFTTYYPAMHLRELEYTLPAALHTAAPARSANTIALPLPCAPLLLADPSPPCGVAEPQRAARAAMTALGSGGGVQIHGTYCLIDALGAATVNREGKGVRD